MVSAIPDSQGGIAWYWAESQCDAGGVTEVNNVLKKILHVHLTSFFIKAKFDELHTYIVHLKVLVGSPSTANLGAHCLLRQTYPNSAKGM